MLHSKHQRQRLLGQHLARMPAFYRPTRPVSTEPNRTPGDREPHMEAATPRVRSVPSAGVAATSAVAAASAEGPSTAGGSAVESATTTTRARSREASRLGSSET